MKPLASVEPAAVLAIQGLIFDLDDTLLTHGRLTLDAYDALWCLHDAGYALIAATGRPIGWAEVIARQWPIAGVVAENGALFAVREGGGRVVVHDRVEPAVREERTVRLRAVTEAVRNVAPTLAFSDDAHHRRTDLAWDIGEYVRVENDLVERVMAAIEKEGAHATRSSVHVHATFDHCEKADGVIAFIERVLRDDVDARDRYAFVGDSPNDESCFQAFSLSIGVANVYDSLNRLRYKPAFVTIGSCGEGFVELAETLLVHRLRHHK